MPTIQLYDNNHTGLNADITFSAWTGGSTYLGLQTIPYTFDIDYPYGTYSLYYSQWGQTCSILVLTSLTITINTSVNCQFAAIVIYGYDNFDLIIDWGDGSPLDYSYQGAYGYYTYHDYPDQLIYTITISVSDPAHISDLASSPNSYGYGCGNVLNLSGLDLFPNLSYIYFDHNILDSNVINSILTSLNDTLSGGVLYLDGQTPPACPSGDGLLVLNHLVNDLGWYAQVDNYCIGVEIGWDSSQTPGFLFYISATTTTNIVIDWGYGAGLDYSYNGSDIYFINKLDFPSNYVSKIVFYFDNPSIITKFVNTASYGNFITYFNNLNLIPNITDFAADGSSYLTDIDLSSNNNLTRCSINATQISGLTLGSTSNIINLDLQSNKLSVTSINDVLVNISGTSITNGNLFLQNQTPPACPTGDGIIAKNHLVNDLGWTVTVDTGCP